jgi:quinol monooxygenase YgiN
MVRLTIAFTASSARAAQELLDALRFLEPVTRLEPGCLQYRNSIDSELTLHHLEDWETEADMRRRVRSEAFTSLLEMVETAREPRVQFDFVSTTRGLDYVAEVRHDFSSDGGIDEKP